MAYIKLSELARLVREGTELGKRAAIEQPDDGGSSNLDRVILYDLKGVQTKALKKFGIDCSKSGPGIFILSSPFPGQGRRREAGVTALYDHLSENGVSCYAHRQMD